MLNVELNQNLKATVLIQNSSFIIHHSRPKGGIIGLYLKRRNQKNE
jgi:hypothetical protein